MKNGHPKMADELNETYHRNAQRDQFTMKTSVIAISALSAFFVSISSANANDIHASQVKVPYYGNQQAQNDHFDGRLTDQSARMDHLQGSINDDRKRIGAVESMTADTRAWTDRQEGVIRQNRRRLDEHDHQIAGNTDRSIGNQQAIGFLQETDAQLSSSISETNSQLAITDSRTIQNARANAATQARVEDVNRQSVGRDKELGGRLDQQAQRDDALAAESGRIESESIQRDTVIAQQVNYNEQVNAAYRRQSAAQFEQHGAAIESNRQDIANERDARQAADRDLQAGIAAAIASGSHIMDANYQGVQMSIAGGAYRGASAASLAIGGALNSNTFAHINVSHDSRGHQAVGGNVNFKF